jgi:tetratricopeptide (TPR) repeat protein/SAM-dependent methyltransferase
VAACRNVSGQPLNEDAMSRKDRPARRKLGNEAAGESDQVQGLFALALRQHQAGQVGDAERLYRAVLAQAPQHDRSLYFLGLLALQLGRPQAAIEWIAKAVALNDRMPEWHYNLAFAYQSVRRFDEAAAHYRRAATLNPSDAKIHTNLGNVLTEQGKLVEAAQCYRQALALGADAGLTCCNLANVLGRQARWAEAIEHYDRALALQPDVPQILTNSAIALSAVGRHEEAVARHERALSLDPKLIEPRMNLGAALQARQQLDGALAQYRSVIALRPEHAEAHNAIGVALLAKNDAAGAIGHFERAVSLQPERIAFRDNLARALLAAGDTGAALTVLMQALRIAPEDDTKRLVVWCLSGLEDFPITGDFRDLVLQALRAPWGRIDDFAHVGAALVTLNPAVEAAVQRAAAAWPHRLDARALLADDLAAIAPDPLLRCLLESSPIGHYALERFLTSMRSVVLSWSESAPPAADMAHAVTLAASLAQQCFINEYIYDLTEEEAGRVQRLQARIAEMLAGGTVPAPLELLALAAHRPLHSLPRLMEHEWPDAVRAVLRQQVLEPQQEADAAASLPILTPIQDDVSRAVRQQYEENPYPRWIKAAPAPPPIRFAEFLRSYFPTAEFAEPHDSDTLDILIAGCGTGQHPIETARQFLGARVLAVDLSRASLAYAQRKTRELGLGQIDYAQADILNLGMLDRRFDHIESFGTLHHMADPWRAWRVLVSLLRPGGVMNIGLYSELARRDVVRARAFIAERRYGSSVEEIRRFRRDLFAMEETHPLRDILSRRDLFSTSNCRDLLFHVQEHRMTLPPIKAFLAENGLRFLGFVLDSRIKRLYARRFPDDAAMTDLDNWHLFEMENPKTFVGLYQIWVQKLK